MCTASAKLFPKSPWVEGLSGGPLKIKMIGTKFTMLVFSYLLMLIFWTLWLCNDGVNCK